MRSAQSLRKTIFYALISPRQPLDSLLLPPLFACLVLQWIDKEGKTPLMVACMRPDLLNVAKVLIELGANVNAYRPGTGALLVFFFFLHCLS